MSDLPTQTTPVVFEGRNQAEAKRAMLKYWSENERELGIGLGEFQRLCAQRNEHKIVFIGHVL